jgi:hypothetical protein
MATKEVQGKELEDPIHGDILEATLSHVPLIYLVPASYVSKDWNGAVSRSLRHINPVKPWLMVHTQNPRAPHMTKTYAYDPRSLSWIEIHAPQIKHTSALRSSQATLLYTLSPTEFSFSVDPLHLTWHRASSPRVWRVDPIVAHVENHIFVVGGACDFEDDPLAVEMYDIESHNWIRCQSMPEMMKDTTTLTWLSVVVVGEFLYLMVKNTGIMYSFNCKMMTWQGPYDLRGEENVFYYAVGTVQNHLMVAGIIGDAENVKGVKVWEVKDELELGLRMVELGVMPKEMIVKLRGESGSELLNSIELVSIGDFVYVYNASEPEEMVVCEVLKRGGCEWWSVTNAVVNDEMRMRRMVLGGADVELEDLKSATLRDCKFVMKQ